MDIPHISSDVTDALNRLCYHYNFLKNKPGRPVKNDEKVALIKKSGSKAIVISENSAIFDSIIAAEPNAEFIVILVDYYGDIFRLTLTDEPRIVPKGILNTLTKVRQDVLEQAELDLNKKCEDLPMQTLMSM